MARASHNGATLAPDEAAIVRRQHLDGMTSTEIADELGIALGAGVEIAPARADDSRRCSGISANPYA